MKNKKRILFKLTEENLIDMEMLIRQDVSACEIAKKFSVHPETVYLHFSELIKEYKIIRIKKNKEKILEEFKKNPIIIKVSEITGHCADFIRKTLKENGISAIKTNQHSLKHRKDENFFEKIDSEVKAYFLGFLYADGCVHVEKNHKRISSIKYSVSFGLKQSDKHILQQFSNLIFGKELISTCKYKNELYEPEARVTVHSKKMCQDLIKLGCVPRKSLILKFPTSNQVPENLIHHFIRGYFDGDGSIHVSSLKPKNAAISIASAASFLESLKKILLKLNIRCNICFHKRKDWGQLQFASKDSIKLFEDFIYQDSTIFLTRKREKFIENTIRQSKINLIPYYTNKNILFRKKRWQARIPFKGNRIFIGCFVSKDDAIREYNKKVDELNNILITKND